ncbi:hypothetical protein [Streptomyces umbrinus]|uniref:hypothetical protein n=1 Tax=Streptomyces umbrinus TaxID=67370 RepID=UPI00340B2681
MDGIPVAEAAQRLSMRPVSTYEAMRTGRLTRVPGSDPARVTLASVQLLADQRRLEAQRRRSDLCALARHVDSLLHAPAGSTYLPPPGPGALKIVPADAFAIFGRDVLEAAANRGWIRKDGCPTCWARMSAKVHQTFGPRDEAAFKILLGQPCAADRAHWRAEAEERRRATVRTESAERVRRTEAERTAARAEFRAAQSAAEAAASRLAGATRVLAAKDPAVAREAAVRARRQAGFTASGDLECGCTARRYCAQHAAVFGTTDRRAARP